MAANPWREFAINAGTQYGTLSGYIRQKDADYFGLDLAANKPAARSNEPKHIQKTGITRKTFTGPDDTTGSATESYDLDYWLPPATADANFKGKQSVRVPYAPTVQTANNKQRYATLRFKYGVSMGAVSEFLYSKLTANKPTYFLSPGGRRYGVVNITGDVNPGTPPAPAPNP